MRFVLITRHDLTDTNALFSTACEARGVPLVKVVAGHAMEANLSGSGPRLIYCAAVDWNARLVEKLMLRPGDAILHDPHFPCDHQPIKLLRAGVPVARAVYGPDYNVLEQQAAWLGGFPVVVKRPGTEGGQGVSLAHDLKSLQDQMQAPDAFGAVIESFVPHALCWRLTVLNGEVLAASASAPPAGDFRSNVRGGRVVDSAQLPEDASDIAIKAVDTLRLDFGGVDLMQGQDGTLTVAEVNFPCFFADQQQRLGIDIAGAIVNHLTAKVSTGRVY